MSIWIVSAILIFALYLLITEKITVDLTAMGLGVNPKPFVMAVCFGASVCFATPIGYQTNLLVYAPAGYRFSDYLKLGIPLNLIVLILGTLLIPIIWPL